MLNASQHMQNEARNWWGSPPCPLSRYSALHLAYQRYSFTQTASTFPNKNKCEERNMERCSPNLAVISHSNDRLAINKLNTRCWHRRVFFFEFERIILPYSAVLKGGWVIDILMALQKNNPFLEQSELTPIMLKHYTPC